MAFSYTIIQQPISLGNRRAYRVTFTDCANDGTSIIYTPFKKVTCIMVEETSTGTSFVRFATTDTPGGNGATGTITLTSSAGTEDGSLLITGLL